MRAIGFQMRGCLHSQRFNAANPPRAGSALACQLTNERERKQACRSRQLGCSALAKCASLDWGFLPRALSGAGHRAGRQLRDVRRDLTWPGQPDLVPVMEDVLHSTPQLPQPERLAQDKGVQHERADQ
jgi:hypothetical protein